MPTGSPWARLPPGLGHRFMSQHPGQEAFCLVLEEPHRVRARRQEPFRSKGSGVEVEAQGLILPTPCPASTTGPVCGGGGPPSGYRLHRRMSPQPNHCGFQKPQRGDRPGGREKQPWTHPKMTAGQWTLEPHKFRLGHRSLTKSEPDFFICKMASSTSLPSLLG